MLGVEVVIVAGGVGSRLRPLTLSRPKPLVPLAGKTLLEHIIEWFRANGFNDILVTAKYLGSMIKEYFSSYSRVKVLVVDSKDTADAVRLVSDQVSSELLFISMSDVLCNACFREFLEFHRRHGGEASIALKEVDNPLHYGLVFIDREYRVKLFIEKPASIELYALSLSHSLGRIRNIYSTNLVNTGFYIINQTVLDILRKKPSLLDWGRHVFPYLVETGYRVYGWVMDKQSYWMDLGRIENYKQALWDLLSGSIKGYSPRYKAIEPRLYASPNSSIEGRVVPPVYIGDNVVIREGATIGPFVSIEDNCVIGRNTSLSYTIVWENTVIENKSSLHNTIVMDNVVIGGNCRIKDSIIASHNKIPANTTLLYKTLKPGYRETRVG